MKSTIAISNQSKRIAEALRLHEIVLTSASQMAVAAALAGLEFKALKKDIGHGPWQEFFEANFGSHGLTIRTAQRYMGIADGLKGKMLKNDNGVSFLPLLESAPSALKKADQLLLTQAVSKAADGKTLSELYQDFGIAKKPQGSGAKGGDTRLPDAPAREATNAEVIAEGRRVQTEQLITTLEESLMDHWWNSADLATRKKLHGLLVDVTAQVKETLK